MKYLVLCLCLILGCLKVSAQSTVEQALRGRGNAEEPSLLAKDAIKLIGKDVYIYDWVDNYKILSDSLSIAYMGGKSSKKPLAIIFKCNSLKLNLSEWVLSKMRVTGKVILYNGEPAIIVTDAVQLATRIQI